MNSGTRLADAARKVIGLKRLPGGNTS
jgi:hypothetical protein